VRGAPGRAPFQFGAAGFSYWGMAKLRATLADEAYRFSIEFLATVVLGCMPVLEVGTVVRAVTHGLI
jgi:hypothetical protein